MCAVQCLCTVAVGVYTSMCDIYSKLSFCDFTHISTLNFIILIQSHN